VALARARWQTAVGCARLTPDAVMALDQHLTGVLLATMAPTLGEAGSADLPLGPLLDRYPVLARLLATISHGWGAAAAEMLARLDADAALLDASFGGPLGAVMGVEAGLSPPYRGQRRVMSLYFAAGTVLVYKPRDLAIEVAWTGLLAWLNAAGAPLPFLVPAVVNQGTHGWAAFVPPAACPDPEAARRYGPRAGMLLCLAYVLRGADCQPGSIVRHGEHPVLVDPSLLLHPQATGYDQRRNSVLRSGLLPAWSFSSTGQIAQDPGGLHVSEADADDLLSGFTAMHDFLRSHAAALLAPGGPLAAFATAPVRFLYRPQRTYGRWQTTLLRPALLKDGADQTIALEVLSRALVLAGSPHETAAETRQFWPVVHAEQETLANGDQPAFMAVPTGDALILPSGQVHAGCFTVPPFRQAQDRVAALDDADRITQCVFIRNALYVPGTGSRPAEAATAVYPSSLTVTAPFRVYDGYGSMAELLVLGLERAGMPVNILPMELDLAGLSAEFRAVAARARPDPAAPVLFFGSPSPELARFRGAPNLFINTMWETDRLPAGWAEQLNAARAVIVPTRFVADVFRDGGVTVPLEVVPEGIDPAIYHFEERPKRAGLTTLMVGTMVERKNVAQGVEAWKRAFADEPDARMILKCRFRYWDYEPDDPRIRFVDANEPTRGIAHWYRQADILMALGNEGFGLPLVEARATGLPVIALTSEGQGDIYAEAPGCLLPVAPARWQVTGTDARGRASARGIPDVDAIAAHLTWIATHPEDARALGRRAADWTVAHRNIWGKGPAVLDIIRRYAVAPGSAT
ncbi:MAG TPA: DUF4135 domain-containing protein, partial [Chloroflexia bacterium]|nr:DUF4135 domain-containing protein [Chloroflexia bacterium]